MPDGNGESVTRAEMLAHLEPMKSDIAEIKGSVQQILLLQAGSRAVEVREERSSAHLIALLALLFSGVASAVSVVSVFYYH